MRLTIDVEFRIGDIVYLFTDPDQSPRMVTAFLYRGNFVSYELSCGTQETYHNGIEISKEKNLFV